MHWVGIQAGERFEGLSLKQCKGVLDHFLAWTCLPEGMPNHRRRLSRILERGLPGVR